MITGASESSAGARSSTARDKYARGETSWLFPFGLKVAGARVTRAD